MAFGQPTPRGSRGGGALHWRFAFQKRGEQGDEYGGTTGAFAEQFRRSGNLKLARGTEKVLAQMDTGVQPAVITVRRCSETETITPAWRARDVRDGTIYNIHGVERSPDRHWIELVVSAGGASG
ncbi:MAG: head-tail adaptor protein [Pseudomonadota bacterium]